jgi:sulfur-carrier protein
MKSNLLGKRMVNISMIETETVRIKLVYFAGLKETLGISSEQLEIHSSEGVNTISDLVTYLTKRGDTWKSAFTGSRLVRSAINFNLISNNNTPIADGDEIAFFPPVTGG